MSDKNYRGPQSGSIPIAAKTGEDIQALCSRIARQEEDRKQNEGGA